MAGFMNYLGSSEIRGQKYKNDLNQKPETKNQKR